MAFRVFRFLSVLVLLASGALSALAQSRPLDVERSTLTVRVFKAGLFSAFGHNHEIRAGLSSGSVDEGPNPSVELEVDARKLTVLDPQLKPEQRAEVQKTMHSADVLDSETFPHIRFRSNTVEKMGDGRFLVKGELELHGQVRPVQMTVKGEAGHYQGTASLKQRDFRIKPVSVAGGTIKVKDEIKIEFEIFPR